MPDQFSKEAMPRVVLLARAGKAADNIAEALRQAGAELVLAADPSQTDEAALRAHGPQVVLIALEPSIEHTLEKFDALLMDPTLTIIYDEADLAAHRAGWDAARWVRHLSAKLRHDTNVLPPGTESDQDWQPSPGWTSKQATAYADMDLAAFTREAAATADSVPSDGVPVEYTPSMHDALSLDTALLDAIPGLHSVSPLAPPPPAVLEIDTFEIESFEAASRNAASFAPVASEPVEFDAVELDASMMDSASPGRLSLENTRTESMPLEAVQFEDDADRAPPAEGVSPMNFDDDAFFLETLSADAPVSNDRDIPPMQFDGGFDTGLDFADDAESGLDAVPAAVAAPRVSEEVLSFEAVMAERTPPSDSFGAFLSGDMSLAPVDESPALVEKPAAASRVHDLSALEARISGLSLVDLDDGTAGKPGMSGSAGDVIGVVLVEAGLGGPDPARQLLSSIPAEFPAVVLVRLHLQGGRYDRLVAQMERAAALPVALAQNGAGATPGTIYFLPDGIGLAAQRSGLEFTADGASADAIFDALPPGDSAVVFLSGSDPQLVDTAMAAAARGSLVIAQSAEDCYDGAACAELRKRGAASGLPAELAGRLASRWPG
ncbi:MAG: chemotaxis protein CheB [Lysobacteraceae bacterium]